MDIVDEITGMKLPNGEEKNVAMFTHLASFASLILPFGNILGPLIVWSLKKDKSEFVNAHGKASLNFEITTIAVFLALAIALPFIINAGIRENPVDIVMSALFLIIPLASYWVLSIVLVIIAAVKASNGELYTYPLSFRFIK